MRPTHKLTPKESALDPSTPWDNAPPDAAGPPWWRLALAATLAVAAIAATASLLA